MRKGLAMAIIARKDALDLEGKCLDRYHFFNLLESGENAPVYLGCDIHNERKVAIKVVHTDYADDIRSQLFNEKALLTAIVHSHIVHMLDFIESPPLALLVTEYAARGS